MVKFIHLLLALGLLGSTLFCLILASFKFYPERNILIVRLSRMILWLLGFALLTGTFLVYSKNYPKSYTFHTPWIQAAYVLVFLSGMIVLLLMYFRKRWLNLLGYFFLILILILIVHDAVTKTVLI